MSFSVIREASHILKQTGNISQVFKATNLAILFFQQNFFIQILADHSVKTNVKTDQHAKISLAPFSKPLLKDNFTKYSFCQYILIQSIRDCL